MKRLVIRHIGPINEVDIRLPQVLVLVGPQSQGKSTIAKLISFCFWLEKHIVSRQSADDVDDIFLQERLLDYHKMRSYFTVSSYLEYESDVIHFKLVEFHSDRGFHSFTCTLKDALFSAQIGKIGYIPAERIAVGFSNIASLKMEDDYIRDFVFDWLSVRTKYGKQNKFSVPDLPMEYYFDEAGGKDKVILADGNEIAVTEASSGLQSMVPLVVYVDYLTHWVYVNKEDISFEQRENIRKSYASLMRDVNGKKMPLLISPLPEEFLTALERTTTRDTERLSKDDELAPIFLLWERISKPHFSQIIIEEPELNVYPTTQLKLLSYVFKSMDMERDSLVLTTHSPYILNVLNLLFRAFDKKVKMEGADLDYDKTAVYLVNEGVIRDICVQNAHLVNPEVLSEPLDKIYVEFEKLG